MTLTDAERAVLDGRDGPAKQKAMDLLMRYGEALGAERLVETNNVAGAFNASTPSVRALLAKGFDAVYSELNLDSADVVPIPKMAVNTCQLITGIDNENWRTQGIPDDLADQQKKAEGYFGARGINMLATCTPYQVGNVPVKGEHCAWMESSAVVYCNAVLGARTNTEGKESTGAAALTGRIPYWGYHIAENRRGTHLVDVDVAVDDIMDWGLLGYWLGEIVQDNPRGVDFTVSGKVVVAEASASTQRVEIQWTVTDAAGTERGRVVQLNEVPKGTLDHYWGEVAMVVVNEASGGVRDVVLEQSGRK